MMVGVLHLASSHADRTGALGVQFICCQLCSLMFVSDGVLARLPVDSLLVESSRPNEEVTA